MGDDVIFSIRDYGKGIDSDRLESIFDGEAYSRNEPSSDGYKGMGIGLSICKTIVTAHGGQISAMNHDQGAEIRFTLPIDNEEMDYVSQDIDFGN